MSFYSKRSFSAYAASSEEETETDWIEKRQLTQDFRKLSLNDKTFNTTCKSKQSACTISQFDIPLHKLHISKKRNKLSERKHFKNEDKARAKNKMESENDQTEQNSAYSETLMALLRRNYDVFSFIASKTPTSENALVPYIDHEAEYRKRMQMMKQAQQSNKEKPVQKDEKIEEEVPEENELKIN